MSYLLRCILATNTAPMLLVHVCHLSDRVSHLAGTMHGPCCYMSSRPECALIEACLYNGATVAA